ncbi:MAG TPA: YlmC/YmxH family sporulation protein [Haloplasmataceae bacterium]
MLLSTMQSKDVVNVLDGSIIGYICDLDLEPNSGQIFSIYIQPNGIFSFFSKKEKICIGWDQIIKIGEDVIIVNYPYPAD